MRLHTRTVLLLAVVAGACAVAPTATATQTTTGRAMATVLPPRAGLPRLARVDQHLFRGAQPTAAGYQALRAMGVRTVISLRNHTDTRRDAESAGLGYVSIPLHAFVTSEPPTAEQVRLFFATVLDPAKQPVFLHCKHGRDRTGAMSAIYRIERCGWTAAEAVEELQAFGFRDVFRDLLGFVRSYRPRGS